MATKRKTAREFWHQGLHVRRVDDGSGQRYHDVVLFPSQAKADEVATRARAAGFAVLVVPYVEHGDQGLWAMQHDEPATPWPEGQQGMQPVIPLRKATLK